MIAYRDASRFESLPAHLEELRRAIRRADPLGALVEAGELEQGVLDVLHPRTDGWAAADDRLRRLTLACAGLVIAAGEDRDTAAPAVTALRCLDHLQALPLPLTYLVRSPEGYVHYALDPHAYADSARRYARDVGAERARAAVIVGLRSIGTSLSAVVAATLCAERTFTIRPRGESGARRVLAGERLQRRLRAWLAGDPDVLLVDEGPGATGETFLRGWEWLRGLGVRADRIVLFTSHEGGFAMAPPERRAWFEATRRYAPPLRDTRPERLAAHFGLSELRDLSGGRWRRTVAGAAREAARASYERMKHAARDAHGRAVMLRYAGAGRWGARADARARALAERGLAPAVLDAAGGFRVQAWAPGRVLRPFQEREATLVRAACDYVVGRVALFNTGEPVAFEGFVRLLEENAGEALTDATGYGLRPVEAARARAGLGQAIVRLLALPDREAVVPDARLQRREWVVGAAGVVKVDAADDGDGLRWPGPTDRAWDIAGVTIELALPEGSVAELVERCARAAGESPAELAAALRAYRPVYAACALGDAALSAREAFTATDRRRLEAEAARYAGVLVRELAA